MLLRGVARGGDRGDGGSRPRASPGHAFIAYVREDKDDVDALERVLKASGVPVWRDTESLWPGEDWRAKIREAITGDAVVFIACFSSRSTVRAHSEQYAELRLAIDEYQERPPTVPWLICVRFNDCEPPPFDLGDGETLASLPQHDLFGKRARRNRAQVVKTARRLAGIPHLVQDRSTSAMFPPAVRCWPPALAWSSPALAELAAGHWPTGAGPPRWRIRVGQLAEALPCRSLPPARPPWVSRSSAYTARSSR